MESSGGIRGRPQLLREKDERFSAQGVMYRWHAIGLPKGHKAHRTFGYRPVRLVYAAPAALLELCSTPPSFRCIFQPTYQRPDALDRSVPGPVSAVFGLRTGASAGLSTVWEVGRSLVASGSGRRSRDVYSAIEADCLAANIRTGSRFCERCGLAARYRSPELSCPSVAQGRRFPGKLLRCDGRFSGILSRLLTDNKPPSRNRDRTPCGSNPRILESLGGEVQPSRFRSGVWCVMDSIGRTRRRGQRIARSRWFLATSG